MGWTGRGGMFLAPAGNPSSLRVGHPDVATEHTDLSPTNPSPPCGARWGRGCAAGMRTAGCSLWEECAGTGRGNTRVRYRRQLAQNEDWVQGTSPQACARTAQLYLPEATSGCPSSARAGAPVGAKEVYSAPVHPSHKRGTHSARRLKSLKNVQLTTQLC